MGVAAIWVLDPKTRTGRMCIGDDWKAARRLEVPDRAIYADLDEMFAYLDQPRP